MPPRQAESPDEFDFNDMSGDHNEGQDGAPQRHNSGSNEGGNDAASKQKRIACVLCRKRKLRCDGQRPTCGTCKRLSHDCAYDEVRRKSGPKRGYVKALEARLQQVETLLKTQDGPEPTPQNHDQYAMNLDPQTFTQGAPVPGTKSMPGSVSGSGPSNGGVDNFDPMMNPFPQDNIDPFPNMGNQAGDEPFPWEMIGLGLDEPLPPQDVINELHQIYFDKIHPPMPLIHRPRYLAALNLAPHMRPPVCLRYIMWTMAASVSDKYEAMQEHFYHRARKYAQMDEMKGHGETTITLGHCQAWVLMCSYEFKLMYFPRAWLSAGRACRLAQMMQLHRLDGSGLDVKQCLPPPKDWTEREERRRTFWMTFCVDRYASIGTGWPMTIEEKDILTNLPATDEAFERSRPHATCSLDAAMGTAGAGQLSPFGGVVLMASLFGKNLTHLHRPGPNDDDTDLNGEFWKRHRLYDGVLLNTALALPDKMRLPAGLPNPNVIFMNMCIHTSAICLHQAAIFKADKHRLPGNVGAESKIRCVTAAAEIASIMRMISHLDLAGMNPFISFCVYVAARVFVQYLKARPKDQQMHSSLQFLLQAMQALKRKNPLTESFLVQLDLDLEGAGISGLQRTTPPYSVEAVVRNGSYEEPPNLDVHVGGPANAYVHPLMSKSLTSPALAQGEIPANTDANQGVNTFNTGQAPQQNPGTTFGDQGLASHTSPNTNNPSNNPSPGPPFPHAAHVNVIPQSYDFPGSPATGVSMDIPTREKSQPVGLGSKGWGPIWQAGVNPNTPAGTVHISGPESQSASEMDTDQDQSGDHPTPSTQASRNGSSSHTSFTPPQNNPSPSNPMERLGKSTSNPGNARSPQGQTASFYAGTDEDFSSIAAEFFPQSTGNPGTSNASMGFGNQTSGAFDMSQWSDLSAGQGFNAPTPMSEGAWNQMLENMGDVTWGPLPGDGGTGFGTGGAENSGLGGGLR